MFELFNPLDFWVVETLSQYTQKSRLFDESLILIEKIEFLKGGVLTAMLWFLWFQPAEDQDHRHEQVLRIIFGGILAVFASQIIQDIAPYRPLPTGHSGVDFIPPLGQGPGYRNFWGGFPSDTSLFTIGLATGIFVVSRPLGTVAFLWTLIVVIFPRLYAGFHFFTDILVGGLIGCAVVLFALWVPVPRVVINGAHWFKRQLPGWFYLFAFVISYQLAGTFADIRTITKLYPTDLGDATRHLAWCARNTAEPKTADILNLATPDGVRGTRTARAMLHAAIEAAKSGDDDAALRFAQACQGHNPRVQDEMARDRDSILTYLRAAEP